MKIAIGIILLVILVLVLRVGELYTQLARYQRYWDRVNQKPVGKDDLVYVAFGDSAAQGIGASKPDKGYVGLIAKQLAEDQPVHVINLSRSGAKISEVVDVQLPKYRELNIKNKQIITLDVGANDVVAGELENFESDMDSLMSKLPKQTIIADIPSFKGSRYARLEDRIIAANVIMHRLAKKHGVELAGVYDNVAGSHSPRTFSADFFHPSDYGYKINWAPVFWQKIKQADGSL